MAEVIRDATVDDIPGMIDVWVDAFAYTPEKQAMLRAEHEADPEGRAFHARVLERDGRCLGVVRTAVYSVFYGASRLVAGDVGFVAVRRECQGQGLGHRLMEDNARWLAAEGFHVARLEGLARFYGRFGWVPFPTRFWGIPLVDVHAGANEIPLDGVLAVDESQRACIRPFVKSRDWDTYVAIANAFHANHPGYTVLDGPREAALRASTDEEKPGRLVYEDEGRVTAYLFARPPSYAITDAGFLPGHEEALSALLAVHLGEARTNGREHVGANMPFDLALADIFRDRGLRYQWMERHAGLASDMVKIVDFKRLLDAALPEFARRWRDYVPLAPARIIWFSLTDAAAGIDFGRNRIVVDEPEADRLAVRLSTADFVQLFLGFTALERFDLSLDPDTPATRAALRALFPVTGTRGLR